MTKVFVKGTMSFLLCSHVNIMAKNNIMRKIITRNVSICDDIICDDIICSM